MPRRTWIGLLASLLAIGAIAAPAALAAKGKAKKKPFNVVTRQATSTTTVTGPQTATATCPNKTVAIGGGYSNPPQNATSFYEPTESARADARSWRASGVTAVGAGAPHTLTTEVRCARVGGKIKTATASIPFSGSSPYFASTDATCPPGTRLVSGGFGATYAGPPPIISVFRNSPTVGGWSARLITSAASGTLNVFAYCLKPPKKKGKVRPKPVKQLDALGALQPGPATATVAAPSCSGKLRGLAGGWSAPDVQPPVSAIPLVHTARFTGSAWTIGAFNYSSTAGTITASGLCG